MKLRRPLAACALVLFSCPLHGCGQSIGTLNQLAASGSIHESAPVKAQVQASIAAPPSRVWAFLIDAPSWPKWQGKIGRVEASGPLAMGMRFSWKTGGTTIHSQVQLVEPERRLSWTGTVFTAKAIHVWELAPQGADHTLLTVKESMDGPLMAHFFSSDDLTKAETEWVNALRSAAEKQP